MDEVRVLRILEYTGPRDAVEREIDKSIHGSRCFGRVVVRAVTLGTYPEIMEQKVELSRRIFDVREGETGKTYAVEGDLASIHPSPPVTSSLKNGKDINDGEGDEASSEEISQEEEKCRKPY